MSTTKEADITTIIPDLPRIVVTESTPMSTNSTSVSSGNPSMNPDVVNATFTVPASGMSSGIIANKPVSKSEKESTGEFQPADNCSQCVVTLDVKAPEQMADASEETDYSGSQEQSTEASSRTSRVWCPEYGGVYGFYSHMSETLVESKYLLPFQFLLLAFTITAGFMGAYYMDECPLSTVTPLFLYAMGLIGTILLLCRILQVVKRLMLPNSPDWWWPRIVILFGSLVLIMCLCLETTAFLRTSPSFDSTNSNYCNETFYNFTYWSNWAALLVFVIVFLLYYPACTSNRPVNDYTTTS